MPPSCSDSQGRFPEKSVVALHCCHAEPIDRLLIICYIMLDSPLLRRVNTVASSELIWNYFLSIASFVFEYISQPSDSYIVTLLLETIRKKVAKFNMHESFWNTDFIQYTFPGLKVLSY